MKYLIAVCFILYLSNLWGQSDNIYDVEANLVEGIGYIHMGKPDKAIAVFDDVIDMDPANSAAQYGLAKAYLEKDQISTAEQHLELALNASLDEKSYYLFQWAEETKEAGLYDQCGASFADLFDLSEDVSDLNKSIYCYELGEHFQKALDVLEKRNQTAGITPSSGKKQLQLLRQLGDQDQYKEVLDELITLFPQDIEFLEVGLEIAQSNDDEEKVKSLAEQILASDPYHAQAITATKSKSQHIALDDGGVPLDTKIATLLRDLSDYLDNPTENKAEDLLTKADGLLQAHSSEPKAVSMAADVYFNTGHIQRAIPLYERLTVSAPQIKPVWNQYLTSLIFINDYDRIVAAQNGWSAYYPIDLYLQLCTAYALLQKNDSKAADPLLEQSELMLFDEKSEEAAIYTLLTNKRSNKKTSLALNGAMTENWFVLLYMADKLDYPVTDDDQKQLSKAFSKNYLLNLNRDE